MSIKILNEWKQDSGNYKCPICFKEYSYKGIASHIWKKHTEEGVDHNKKTKIGIKGRIPWNKGLSSDTNDSLKKMRNTLKERYKSGEIKPSYLGKKHSKETIKKLKQNTGGYRKGSGRGKSGWYNEYWCDSTWELAWVIYNLDNNIKFNRFDGKFQYMYKEELFYYHPDFILDDNKTIIEIKSYETEKDLCKYTGVDKIKYNFVVLKKNDIEPIIKYVKEKYKVINLYDLYTERKIQNNKKISSKAKIERIKSKKKELNNENITKQKEIMLNSNVDFKQHGWNKKISDILNISHASVTRFMKKYMLDFYNNECCIKGKSLSKEKMSNIRGDKKRKEMINRELFILNYIKNNDNVKVTKLAKILEIHYKTLIDFCKSRNINLN